MAEADPVTPPEVKGVDAAAILLMVLSDEEASELLGRLEPAEVQQLGAAMFSVSDVTEPQVNQVFDQFISRARQTTSIGFGSAGRIRSVMESALGPDRAENILARITPATRSRALDDLRWMDPKTIAGLIAQEHPQVAALVLSHLDAPIAAEVLELLPAAMQGDVIYRVATLDSVTAEALEDLERILVREVARSSAPSTSRGGATEAAKIMNNMVPGSDQRIIRNIAKLDKNVAQTIQDEMFVFDNLIDMDDKNLGLLMRSIDTSILVVALKGADDKLKERIFGCMSTRAADTIRDEMEERGPMRLVEVLDAQKEVLAVARRLAEDGTLMLPGRGGDYV
ncbi:flagellar motor switch protein FliG [Sphingomonas sp. LY54]|uniref:flagellar motor switch protein FliG n=1 Tax=Sphingomonadales TaxID=204457 RepID=UPI002ADED565|nr:MULTISPECIES: flagellar motor switch protein FliG [Sphingomonadales]MEA1015944.1 flagellar motor switch protein FliG [Sphingosinicella sp. LY1275]WRP28313.1 flagellar motor switch protein FliG [Sphingomonas sp. LY54]